MPPRRKTLIRIGPAGVEAGAAKARTDGVKASAVEAAKRWRRLSMASPRLEGRRHGAVGQHAPRELRRVAAGVPPHARVQAPAPAARPFAVVVGVHPPPAPERRAVPRA